MVAKDSAFLKSQRIKAIAKMIAVKITELKQVPLKKLISLIEYEHGLTYKTARKYIELICEFHNWEIIEHNGVIVIKVI